MDPVSFCSSLQSTYGMIMARKNLDNIKEQGDQALTLIDGAKAAAPAAPSGSVGRLIDVKA